MTGIVNAALEATLHLPVQGASGQAHEIEAIVDTGFNGFLTLPLALIAALGLPWLCRQQGRLADGSVLVFDVHEATVVWDDEPRTVEVEAADAEPLIGMGLMPGSELRAHVVPGGLVTIAAVP